MERIDEAGWGRKLPAYRQEAVMTGVDLGNGQRLWMLEQQVSQGFLVDPTFVDSGPNLTRSSLTADSLMPGRTVTTGP